MPESDRLSHRSASSLSKLTDEADPDQLAESDEEDGTSKAFPMGKKGQRLRLNTIEDSDSDGSQGYIDRLDQELEAMYADYVARSKRRAVAQLKEAEESGPKSKNKRRVAINSATEKEDETPDEMARRVAVEQFRSIDEDELDMGGRREKRGRGATSAPDDSDSDGRGVDEDKQAEEAEAYARNGRQQLSAKAASKKAKRGADAVGNPLLVQLERPLKVAENDTAARAASAWFANSLFQGMQVWNRTDS